MHKLSSNHSESGCADRYISNNVQNYTYILILEYNCSKRIKFMSKFESKSAS